MLRRNNALIIFLVVFTFLLNGCANKSDGSNNDSSSGNDEKDVVEINIGHVGAPISPQEGAAEIFEDLLEEKTDGSVKVNVFNSGQLGDEREIVEGIQMNTIDSGIISAGLFSSHDPVMAAFEVPFLFDDREHALRVNNGEIGRDVLNNLEVEAGLRAIAIWEHGFRQITNDIRPIKEPSDMDGLQIRSPEVQSYSVALEALGATPIPMSFDELYVALDRGVVDGQHNPLMHVEGQNFHEVQDYLTVMDFAYTPNVLAFSEEAWERLTDEQQELVIEAALEPAEIW